ncbi:hypothetical protein NKR23_g4193 [Pleurostoma richardsiae]|uniref:Uncharacterized protein n=1 Tax=Pleurostoma richardsiae TaxID=41990 RepID=A0AA38RVP8_9PEZI|nr:hypothetical protein NKR23_g4193 [Pleurostoma richardsiae]
MRAPRFKLSFQSVVKDNEQLTTKLESLIASKQQNGADLPDEDTKEALAELYTRISDLSEYGGQVSASDKTMMAAWTSFMDPIERFTLIHPHGDFLSARMLLYLAAGFLNQHHLPSTFSAHPSSAAPIALRLNFLTALDDALLVRLGRLWKAGGRHDDLPWVFADYQVQKREASCDNPEHGHFQTAEEENASRARAACITRPSDATPANGVQGRRVWVREDGDTAPRQRHPDARGWCYAPASGPEGPGEDQRVLIMEEFGSDGPVRGYYSYSLTDADGSGQQTWRGRPALRRSRQFVLDARRVAARAKMREQRRLGLAATAARLPPELHMQIAAHLELEPAEHPYVHALDLAEVYRPFPEGMGTGGVCEACKGKRLGTAEDRVSRRTCPLKSIRAWNLPLRAFHTYHQKADSAWRMCKEGGECAGHHRGADESWEVGSEAELEALLDRVVQARCGDGATLKSVGIGPMEPLVMPTREEDDARKKRLFEGYHLRDEVEEAEWTGVAGLMYAMVHGRTLLGRHPSGSTSTDARWLLCRTRADEAKVMDALRWMHRWCDLC